MKIDKSTGMEIDGELCGGGPIGLTDMGEDFEEKDPEEREKEETIKKLKAEKKEIERKIRLLTDTAMKITERARLTRDKIKGKWQIAVIGSYYTQKKAKGEIWWDARNRPYDEKKLRWIPIIQETTEDRVRKELKEIIKALKELEQIINQ